MTQDLAALVLEKIREQVERLDRLLALIPPGAPTSAALPIRKPCYIYRGLKRFDLSWRFWWRFV